MGKQNLTEKKLTSKQRKAIPIILAAPSITEGCREAGISREAFYGWQRNPVFMEEWTRQQNEAIEGAIHTLKASLTDAVTTLTALLKADGSMGEGTRLKASLAILESVFKVKELEEFEKRLAILEKELKK